MFDLQYQGDYGNDEPVSFPYGWEYAETSTELDELENLMED